LIRAIEEASREGRNTLEAAQRFLKPIRQALDAIA
jgi:hypothetical protein